MAQGGVCIFRGHHTKLPANAFAPLGLSVLPRLVAQATSQRGETKVCFRSEVRAAFFALWHREAFAYLDEMRVSILDIMTIRKRIKEEIDSIRECDPAARSDLEILLTYSGLHAIVIYRIAHRLYVHQYKTAARVLSQIGRLLTGVAIHPGAKIGKRFFIDHGAGVVIGETTVIGDDCLIYQGATLGGTGKDKGKRHPTLGNNVMVGAGARILGPFTVGDNAKIAANAVVLEAVPANATAVGVPARVVRRGGEKVTQDLDHIHIPDPVSQELCRQRAKIEELEKELEKLKNAN